MKNILKARYVIDALISHICYLLNRIILDDKCLRIESVSTVFHTELPLFISAFARGLVVTRATLSLSHGMISAPWRRFAVNTSRLAHNSQMNVLTSLRWETKVV